jgi:hypothetical protein
MLDKRPGEWIHLRRSVNAGTRSIVPQPHHPGDNVAGERGSPQFRKQPCATGTRKRPPCARLLILNFQEEPLSRTADELL